MRVKKDGIRLSGTEHLRAYYLQDLSISPAISVVVPSGSVKSAVARNSVRRKIRAIVSNHKFNHGALVLFLNKKISIKNIPNFDNEVVKIIGQIINK